MMRWPSVLRPIPRQHLLAYLTSPNPTCEYKKCDSPGPLSKHSLFAKLRQLVASLTQGLRQGESLRVV